MYTKKLKLNVYNIQIEKGLILESLYLIEKTVRNTVRVCYVILKAN